VRFTTFLFITLCFYSRFLRKTRSNRGSPQRSAPERKHARAATRCAAPPRASATPRQRSEASVSARARSPRNRSPRPPLHHAARMPRMSGPPRRRTATRNALRSVGRCRPRGAPSVRKSLGGSHCSYKGAAALASARQTPSNRTEPPPAPLRAAAASSEFKPTTSQIKPSFTAPSTYRNYRAAPPVVPGLNLAGAGRTAAGRGCRRRAAPPGPPPPGLRSNPAPSNPSTAPRPSPTSPPPAFVGIWPEPHRPVPRTTLQRSQFF
jgi:hypothetical protein